MLTLYIPQDGTLLRQEAPVACPENVLWIDMFEPTAAQEALIERTLGIDVPTREDMKGIELSNRLYEEDGALFMTANLIAGTDTDNPQSLPVGFILAKGTLITVRYHDPRAFQIFQTRIQKAAHGLWNAPDFFIDFLETVVDRLSNPLEEMTTHIDRLSADIFLKSADPGQVRDFTQILKNIGREGDLNSKVRDALLGLDRLVTFLQLHRSVLGPESGEVMEKLQSIEQDIRAMTDHANFLSNKINFLLEAILGLISIEQNGIIKFFSVAAVVFLPPTLIASIYGMNFEHMPELSIPWAYPATVFVMLLSAVVPYWYFKWRKWL